MLLFNSFVECHFNYCSFIWHFCSKLNTYKVEKIQAKALKCVTLKYKASYCDLLEKCNKSPLFISRLHRFLEIIFKTKHNMYPDYINKMFMPKNVYYNTRINDNMHVPKYNTVTYGKHCLKYMAPFYWNKLPNDFKEILCVNEFKSKIKQWIPVCRCGFCVQCNILNM